MTEGFILLITRPGALRSVVKKVREVAGVLSADPVLGPYDVVVRVGVRHHSNITSVVLPAIQEIAEVERTVTCLAEDDAGS